MSVKQDEDEEEKILIECQDLPQHESWLRLEESRQLSHWMPWKPSANETEDDCEDPSRMVVSDDIVDFLFVVRSKTDVWLTTWTQC